MPDQENISSDTARSVLQHLMFGVLFVLIILNWRVHRPMDYAVYNEAFENSETLLNAQSKMKHSVMLDIIEEREENSKDPFEQRTSLVIASTKALLDNLDSIKTVLQNSKNFVPSVEEKKLGESAIKLSRKYYTETVTMMGFAPNGESVNQLPLNEKSLNYYDALLNGRYFALEYFTKQMMISILSSIKNDAINNQQILVDRLFDNVNEGVLHCEFFRAIAYSESNIFFLGQHIKGSIGIATTHYYRGNNYFEVKVNSGTIDDISLRSENIALWKDKASQLGINSVKGDLVFKLRKQLVKLPFSFSYFVSAPGVAFHLDKANVCYVGVPNVVSINIPGYTADKIRLRVAGAKVQKVADGEFEILFSKMPAGKVYAYVDATNAQGRTSTVHSMELKVKSLPAPLTNFDVYKEEGIALADFKALKSLQLFAADSAFAVDYSVASFQVECIHANHQYTEPIEVKGADFETNVELQKLFAAAQPGDRFLFSNIIAKGSNGQRYEVLPVSVFIKDTP